jgi:hypothetical protein
MGESQQRLHIDSNVTRIDATWRNLNLLVSIHHQLPRILFFFFLLTRMKSADGELNRLDPPSKNINFNQRQSLSGAVSLIGMF